MRLVKVIIYLEISTNPRNKKQYLILTSTTHLLLLIYLFASVNIEQIMDYNYCPSCSQLFSAVLPPKKLKNCDHSLCDSCLPTVLKCPIDQKRIDYRRYTPKAFQINHQLLQKLTSKNSSPKSNSTNRVESSPKRQSEICLLHSKPADIICVNDGSIICSSCALFGEHRGHTIKNCDEFLRNLTIYTQQALQVFDKLKEKQQSLSEQIISEYIDDCFKEQKNHQVKNIKTAFAKLIEKIKKIEKIAISRIDNEIKQRKEILMRDVSIQQMQGKKCEWFKEVQALGSITQEAYQFRHVQDALKYLDESSPESFLLKRGQYLHLQYCSSQNAIKNKIDAEVAKLTANFNDQIEKSLEQFCTFLGNTEKKQGTPSNLKQSSITLLEKKVEDDILIDQIPSSIDLVQSCYRQEMFKKGEYEKYDNQSGYLIGIKLPEVPIVESIQHSSEDSHLKQNERDKGQKYQRSKSSRKKSVCDLNIYSNREALGILQNKKRRKIQIPDKYKQVFEDLKNDKTEVIDFGGAELGDQNILALCQYIEKTNKLRNLKLVRNKISDDVLKDLLNACYSAKVTSLNLGQNLLTQKSLQMLEAYDIGELRNITLSLNKINRRNVKNRLDQFVKRGITLSI